MDARPVKPFDIAQNNVTLVGGPGDGQTVTIGWLRRWYCYTRVIGPIQYDGGSIYIYEQYAPDAEGIWRPIDQYHPHYLRP